jgi:hypothetical protein
MKYFVILLMATGLVLGGCKKKEPSPVAPGTNANAVAAAPQQPLPPPPAPIAAVAQNAPQQAVAGEVNAFLTQQLRIFVQQKGRLPNSFAEFAATRLDSTPGAPSGKKWVIDASTREVKAVPAK